MKEIDSTKEPNQVLIDVYNQSDDISDIDNLKDDVKSWLNKIGENCYSQKGVYTVLITLMLYKVLYPDQDIRIHQKNLQNGFSGRSFDTKYVTPTLKELGLPSMAESGWLTRSLEQPYPYNLEYNGKIQVVKNEFLNCVDEIQKNPNNVLNMMRILFNTVTKKVKEEKVVLKPLTKNDKMTIDNIVAALDEHFNTNYKTHNGSKLPVLAFHAIFQSVIKEIRRYDGCYLAPLASLTACDRTNKASGDVEIFKDGEVFESIEIKLDRKINAQILRVAKEKIYRFNPQRYYILSVSGIDENEKNQINDIVSDVLLEHGCQIIIDELLPTIRYYLRLINHLEDFVINYTNAVRCDSELRKIHKEKWAELIKKYKL